MLVAEYIDESLVLLQRLLCWDLTDVTYLKQRVRQYRYKMTPTDEVCFNTTTTTTAYIYCQLEYDFCNRGCSTEVFSVRIYIL